MIFAIAIQTNPLTTLEQVRDMRPMRNTDDLVAFAQEQAAVPHGKHETPIRVQLWRWDLSQKCQVAWIGTYIDGIIHFSF